MNLGDLSDMAQIVSAVGVIVSLIYLAIQVRQNTASMRAASFQELLNHISQVNLRIVDDPTVAKLMLEAANQDFDSGSIDGFRWRTLSNTSINLWFHAFSQHREGTITQEQWQVLAAGVRRTARYPAMQATWRRVRKNFPGDFQQFMDAEMESSEGGAGAA